MLSKICEKCDQEMKLVPAGVSKKTGKPYSAFWSCDKRNGGCGATARAEGEASQPAPGGYGEPTYHAASDRLATIEQKLDEILELLRNR